MKKNHNTYLLICIMLFCMGCSSNGGTTIEPIRIGDQVWSAKNLDVKTYKDGTEIPEAKSDSEWFYFENRSTGCWCYYNNDPANGAKYGKLYNWHAIDTANGHGGLKLPEGFHVPYPQDFRKLIEGLGGAEIAGKHLKATTGWMWDHREGESNGDNTSGWGGLPAGYRILGSKTGATIIFNTTIFDNLSEFAYFWGLDADRQFPIILKLKGDGNYAEITRENRSSGLSVRCVKD